MALTKLAKINENSLWAVWKIEESLFQLLDLLPLSPLELRHMEAMVHHPKKKMEWAAGRLALQSLLNQINIAEWEIIKDSHGKPHLASTKVHISLANSYPFATAIIHRHQAVGIDIEYPSEKLLRVRHKFLNKEELQKVETDLNLLCIFWCAKESVYKIHGRKMLSFKDHIFIKNLDMRSGNISVQVVSPEYQAYHKLSFEQIEDFYIVYNL